MFAAVNARGGRRGVGNLAPRAVRLYVHQAKSHIMQWERVMKIRATLVVLLGLGAISASAGAPDGQSAKVAAPDGAAAIAKAGPTDGGRLRDSGPSALIFYSGETGLLQTRSDWLDHFATCDTQITETDSAASFESLYRSQRYTYVVAITNDVARITSWKADVPSASAFAANWMDNDAIAMLIRVNRTCGECPSPMPPPQPSEIVEPATDMPWWGGIKDWLKRVLPCVQGCMAKFIAALPDDIEMEVSIKVSTTPPNVEVTTTLKGNSGQIKKVIHASTDLVACMAGCL